MKVPAVTEGRPPAGPTITGVGACTAEALEAFAGAVGRRHVVTGRRALGLAGRTTFATGQRLAAIVRPGTVEQVQAAMRVAYQHGVAVHRGFIPVTRSKSGESGQNAGKHPRIRHFGRGWAGLPADEEVRWV